MPVLFFCLLTAEDCNNGGVDYDQLAHCKNYITGNVDTLTIPANTAWYFSDEVSSIGRRGINGTCERLPGRADLPVARVDTVTVEKVTYRDGERITFWIVVGLVGLMGYLVLWCTADVWGRNGD